MGVNTPAIADAAAPGSADARARIRAGEHTGPTSGLAPGFAQANLVILTAGDALDFLRFCVRNPKPCPLLEVTDTGSPHPTALSRDADLRTDVPRYRVFEDGELVDEPTDLTVYWRDDLVSFLLGCSFTFEWALADARSATGASTTGRQRSDVRHRSPVRRRRTVRGSFGRVDEAVRIGRRRAGDRDLVALPGDARRTGSCR